MKHSLTFQDLWLQDLGQAQLTIVDWKTERHQHAILEGGISIMRDGCKHRINPHEVVVTVKNGARDVPFQ